jgi:hypothetical protein
MVFLAQLIFTFSRKKQKNSSPKKCPCDMGEAFQTQGQITMNPAKSLSNIPWGTT